MTTFHPARNRHAWRLATRLVAIGAWGPVLALVPHRVSAQGTLADYGRAATVTQRLAGLTVDVAQSPTWIGPTRFWYRTSVKGGTRFVLVDAPTAEKRAPFDHARLATALTNAAAPRTAYTATTLPFSEFAFANGDADVDVDANGSRWRCTLADYRCTRVGAATAPEPVAAGARGPQTRSVSIAPDGRTEAFIQNYNVAIRAARDTAAVPGGRGAARVAPVPAAYTMLSADGSEADAYQPASVRWSPDSRKLAAFRRRPGFSRMVHYVMTSPTDQLQPKDTSILYRKPGDVLDVLSPVLFDVATHTQRVIDNTLFPNAYQLSPMAWRNDSHAFTFEYNQRGHQVYRIIEVDAESAKPRAVISEEVPTFFPYRSVGNSTDTGKNWRCDVDDGREILWMSERDGWNHLYLYDGAAGRVKNQVTKGGWVVRGVDSVDVAHRQVFFRASGMVPGQDPYFIHYYRVNFDGTGLVRYTQADGNHAITWSPDHQYFVDQYSRVDLPTITELHRVSDMRVTRLEQGDMSAQLATGWRPPEVFVAKGRDGKTDIWGIVVRPLNFDPAKKSPVVEQIYAGPQGSFVPKSWGGGQALQSMAELGFVLVQVDGMGTNNRSKAFHDVAWKNLGDAGFADRILWHRALGAKYPWYDTTRVGLYGTSAGGQNAMGGLLFHPEFYKAAYANSGSHDNRMDKIWWNEQWMGWPLGPQYEASSNAVNAGKLRGHLMLVIGELDTNVDPASGYQVVNALIQAGKYFDLLVVPNGGHGAGGQYAARKRNDFFVQWLLGVQPPSWNEGVTELPGTGAPREP